MANLNKVSFSVSVTPKINISEADNYYAAHDIINESVRKTVGGSGEITGDDAIIDDTDNNGSTNGSWNEGSNTAVTSNGSTLVVDASTDLVFIKHTGLLFGTSNASAAADTVQIKIDASATSDVSGSDSVVLAELRNGEAMIFPTPGSTYGLIFASGDNHVGVETLIIGT